MHVSEILQSNTTSVSFEIFPPKKELPLEEARSIVSKIVSCSPDFISVTCSAGGSGNSANTIPITAMIQDEFDIPAVAHQTCAAYTKQEIDELLIDAKGRGIENFLALRGDNAPDIDTHEFLFAKDLIPQICAHGLCAGAAAYPEGHIDCFDFDTSIKHLKEKQDAGAAYFITQMVYDNSLYYRFIEAARDAGITVPISVGIMPFNSKSRLLTMMFLAGITIPSLLVKTIARYEHDPSSLEKAGIEYACNQIEDLIKHGVDGIHIYMMNMPPLAHALHDFIASIKE